MPDYRLFGGILRSELDFPDLTPTTGHAPRWVLTRKLAVVDTTATEELGREEVDAGVSVALCARAKALRLVFDDTGVFDVSSDGRRIDWFPPAEPNLDSVRKDVLGRVIAACLHQEGVLTLHGSAVGIGASAIAFLAPKFHGKSTIAAALVRAGARFLADDIVAVSAGAIPVVTPGVPAVHLFRDSAARIADGSATVRGGDEAPKLQLTWDDEDRTGGDPMPLAAVYLLAPADSVHIPSRDRLPGQKAALALMGHAKIGALLGVQRRARLLLQMSELAARVSVFRLSIPRDLARLSETTDALTSWHS